MDETIVSKLQKKIRETSEKLMTAEIDKNGLTLSDITPIMSKHLGWRARFNVGGRGIFRIALRREGWCRRQASRRWFYDAPDMK